MAPRAPRERAGRVGAWAFQRAEEVAGEWLRSWLVGEAEGAASCCSSEEVAAVAVHCRLGVVEEEVPLLH